MSDYEVTSTFPAQYHGVCTIDPEHTVKRGDLVGKVRRSDNPMLPSTGVACKACVVDLPRARR